MEIWATIVFIGPEPSQAGVRNPRRDVHEFRFWVKQKLQMRVNYDSDPVIHISSNYSISIDHTLLAIM